MIYHFLIPLQEYYGAFRVFRYISFRMAMAILTSMIICFLFGPLVIKWLRKMHLGQQVRDDGPRSHLSKEGTPTMGGILIIVAATISCVLWSRLDIDYVWIALLVTLLYAFVGFLDDFLKIKRKNSKGLTARGKILLQLIIATIAAIYLVSEMSGNFDFDTRLVIPFFKSFRPDIHIFYLFLIVLVILAASNSVNLTDGLDGLAIGPVMVASLTFLILAYISGHAKMADYLAVQSVSGAGELAVFCGALLGAGLGFLWYNTYPAQVFMGDVGSLSLGAALGIVSIIIKQELLLIIVGGVFVLETVSVIVQVISFKTMGRRIFKMAPLHHHFELKGWAEPKVIVRFWIVSIILALIALSTLKLR